MCKTAISATRSSRGFTLLELMMGITIFGILLAIDLLLLFAGMARFQRAKLVLD